MKVEKSVARQIAEYLLEIEAVQINPENPFTWASGWKSPVYCDNRLSLSYPHIRSYIKKALINLIKNRFSGVEAVAGVATAGIPQGALVANDLDLPFLYVRPKPKSHGTTNQIEGKVREGQKIVVVEDLVSTGGSSVQAIHVLREANADVSGLVSIFTYGFLQSYETFKKAKVEFYALTDFDTLLEVALALSYIRSEQLDHLKKWSVDPGNWG